MASLTTTADQNDSSRSPPLWRPGRTGRVLVTDGNQRSSLAAVRALAESGYEVAVCSDRKRTLAGSSRYCRRSFRVVDPLKWPDRYVDEVAELSGRLAVDVVLPMTEPSLLALLPERQRLKPAVVPFGDYDSFSRLLDKDDVLRRAPRHGIAVPSQVRLDRPDSEERSSVGELRFPVVLKPSRSVGVSEGGRKSVEVTHVTNPSEFEAELARQTPASFPLLVQERIGGLGVGIFLLLDEEGVAARFAHRRLREKPPSGGVSVLRESIRPEESLFEKARALLEDFGWTGVAMVEFKVSEESGEPYLMEVNPRLWGSLQLAIDAGVDFPTLLVDGALGERVPRILEYEAGVRTRWLWGDVDHLLASVRSAIGGDGKSFGDTLSLLKEAVGGFASGWRRGTRLEVLRFSDPGPFLRESVDWWGSVF